MYPTFISVENFPGKQMASKGVRKMAWMFGNGFEGKQIEFSANCHRGVTNVIGR